MKLTIRIAGDEEGEVRGYRAVLTSARVASEEGVKFASHTLPVDGSGKVIVPEHSVLEAGDVNVTILDPTGRPAGSLTTTRDKLTSGEVVEVQPHHRLNFNEVQRVAPIIAKLRVTVLDERSSKPLVGVGVELASRSGGASDWVIMGSSTTDAAGNVSFVHTKPTLDRARVVVAGTEYASIPLNTSKLPKHAIVRVRGVSEENCACDSAPPHAPDHDDLVNSSEAYSVDLAPGGCVDFRLRPDRSLFEMRYSAVVRTTQPEVKRTLSPQEARREALDERIDTPPGVINVMASTRSTPRMHWDLELLPPQSHLLTQLREDPKTFLDEWPKRPEVSQKNPIRWDDDSLDGQAQTVAHGHVITYRQSWHADGYSLGDLLYSLPLAPCQKKQIAILDWDREDAGRGFESTSTYETLEADLMRDRSIIEDMASGFGEMMDGGSSSHNWSASMSGGLFGGAGFLGVSAGYGGSSSEAWQKSSRNLAANFANTLRDRTMQAQSVMRGQRSTVVKSVAQHEHVRAQTEVVANHNHCHAMTVQYFQVLRHFIVKTSIDSVRECLFVPLTIEKFTEDSIRKHSSALRRIMRDPDLRHGIFAAERLSEGYEYKRKAELPLDLVQGELELEFQLRRPDDKEDEYWQAAWAWATNYYWNFNPKDVWKRYIEVAEHKDEAFQKNVVPLLLEEIVNRLTVVVGLPAKPQKLDLTLISFTANRALIGIRSASSWENVARDTLEKGRVSIKAPSGPENVPILPPGSKLLVKRLSLSHRYAGERSLNSLYAEHTTFEIYEDASATIGDATSDDGPLSNPDLTDYDFECPAKGAEDLDREALDKRRATRLVKHLNENLERYHRELWMQMDPGRRYLLLDRYAAPHTEGLSIAQVTDNEVLGIVGNCLVLPLAPGVRIDPRFKSEDGDATLDDLYTPESDFTSIRFTSPTKGVFAEAVMGHCNSCEVKDETRFWRWEESPCPDNPTPIMPLDTGSRYQDAVDLTPTALPQPIVNIQNAPPAPDPTGLGGVVGAMTAPFQDITGLEGTQSAASNALQASMKASQSMALAGAKLLPQRWAHEKLSDNLNEVRRAYEAGGLSEEKYQQYTSELFDGIVDAPTRKADSDAELDRAYDLAKQPGDFEYTDLGRGITVRRSSDPEPTQWPGDADDDGEAHEIIISIPASLLAGAKKLRLSGSDRSRQSSTIDGLRELPNGAFGFDVTVTRGSSYTLEAIEGENVRPLFEDLPAAELIGDDGFKPITAVTEEVKEILTRLGGLALDAIAKTDETEDDEDDADTGESDDT